MTLRPSVRYFLLPGVGIVALAVAVVAVHELAPLRSYPLTVWRVDLDDAAIGLGTILVGVAAIWTVYLKATRTEAKVDAVEARLNGGMAEYARQHVQESEVIAGLVHRMDRFEAERDECRHAVDECREERRQLHERLIDAIGHPHE